MAHSANSNPVPKLYRSIIEDVIDGVREIFTEEGIDEQVLKDLRRNLWSLGQDQNMRACEPSPSRHLQHFPAFDVSQCFMMAGTLKNLLWESKVMLSKATEGFFRDHHHNSTQFVLQLPQHLHQTLQTSTASLVIPAGRNIQNFTSAELGSSVSGTTFTLPAGISYPIHVPAGVTLQTASGHLYKVNVPVMVTQTPGGPRILHHQQLFQHLGHSFQNSVSQLKTSETVSQKLQQQESFPQLPKEPQVVQQKELVNGNVFENSRFDTLTYESAGTQQQITTNLKLSEEKGSLDEHNPKDAPPALSNSKLPELVLGNEAKLLKIGLTSTCQPVQEQLSKEPHNLVQQRVPDDTAQLISLDDLDENLCMSKESCTTLSEEMPTVGRNTNVQNDTEIIQIDGAGDTSSDEEVGTARDVEDNEFLGIIDTEDLKALEGDSASNEDSTSDSSDEEEPLIDVIEELTRPSKPDPVLKDSNQPKYRHFRKTQRPTASYGPKSKKQDPLNSGDDVSEQEVPDLFDTDNVIVCQYDKIHRSKNKWKFYLKDGVMSFGGKDYVFSKAIGEAEWPYLLDKGPGGLKC